MPETAPRPWRSETASGERPFTLVRHRHAPGDGFPRHGHRFSECFWLESGRYRHDRDGLGTDMLPGDIAFLGPGDWHSGSAGGPSGGVIVNLAFPTGVAAGLADDLGAAWPWRALAGRTARLSHSQLGRLQAWLCDLQPPGNTLPGLLGLLADLAHMLASRERSDGRFPPWLAAAVAAFSSRDPLPPGVDGFITAAGRSPEHTARAVRRLTGRSLTNFLNDIRLDRAATWLHWSTDTVEAIGVRCGLRNMPHFYRCFRRRFGHAPGAFRARPEVAGVVRELPRGGSVTVLA